MKSAKSNIIGLRNNETKYGKNVNILEHRTYTYN